MQKDTVFDWKLSTVERMKTWSFNVTNAPGAGTVRDDVSKGTFIGDFTAIAPPGYDPPEVTVMGIGDQINMRWDHASNLARGANRDGAAIFDYIQPLVYHLTGQGIDEVAEHVQFALQHAGSTIPSEPTKFIPGGDLDHPLHRPYRHYSLVNNFRYVHNGRDARKWCKSPRPAGQECDEYPFAATYEGAAKWFYEKGSDPNAFSVKLVDASQNGRAGNEVNKQFFWNYRVLDPGYDADFHPTDLDSFYMKIEP
ncbi:MULTISPECIES: NucA/NucB deoxyribonuclease domain-containing protein [unclassified Streptomyces]|uniref:NucA/NucB deoxyribonuclease domain-containing protein n=1 Tax=unclassified Streptomyces TaxID=2593676 RepID=UPI00404352C5